MCYILLKNVNKHGCYALKAQHNKALVELKHKLEERVNKDVQVVLISRPTAYGEYAPYSFAENEEELLSIAASV